MKSAFFRFSTLYYSEEVLLRAENIIEELTYLNIELKPGQMVKLLDILMYNLRK